MAELRLNADELVEVAAIGEIVPPKKRRPYEISPQGEVIALPGTGAITYNVRVGIKAFGWASDHVEPGVTVKNLDKDEGYNTALNVYTMIGNKAKVVSGDAKGAEGTVTGKHGGAEHVLVDFEPEVMEQLVIGDKVQVRTKGLGLRLLDHPEVKVFNLSPELLVKTGVKGKKGSIEVAVARVIPAALMGSGLGKDHVYQGDYDIQLHDREFAEESGLLEMRLGDIVAITDTIHTHGRSFRKGAVSIGVVVHADCVTAGHGPGVTTVLSGPPGSIAYREDEGANIAEILGIGARG